MNDTNNTIHLIRSMHLKQITYSAIRSNQAFQQCISSDCNISESNNTIHQFKRTHHKTFSMNIYEFIFMMMKKYSEEKKSIVVLSHSSLLLSNFFGMMLGRSKSKLTKHGENLEKVCLIFSFMRVWVLPCQWRLNHLLNSQD